MRIEASLFFYLIVEFASAQYTSKVRLSKTPCEIHGTALVEQFFNVIFTEFQHSPPTCACVQMCPDQPTYCYPNGCFKRAEKKKETSPVSSIQQDAKTVFLINNDRDVIEDLMGNANVISQSVAGNAEKRYQRPWEINSMSRNNPFKEIVFKYKRIPKLQVKYNLREQVKHSRDKKAEVDLSKTRWPTNKQTGRQLNRQKTSNYLMFSETNQPETPKYFKRYLTKRENQNGLDISALYLYKDASNFSLETLIDNLIERGFEGVNNTSGFQIANSSKMKEDDSDIDIKLTNSIIDDLKNDTNETALIVNTTELNNNSKYKDNYNNINSSTAAYFEMITTLSKQIEKQNNISMEVMGNLTTNIFKDISEVKPANTLPTNISNTANNFKSAVNISTDKDDRMIKFTTRRVPEILHQAFIPVINGQVKKSKQRIVRKLRNRKLN